jgi:hypothetical protein
MTFADPLHGEAVFVDANTLVHHFTAHTHFGAACTQLLQRIENQELLGFTSTHVLGEAAHRLMTTEASSRFGWPFAGIGNRLRTNPADALRARLTACPRSGSSLRWSAVPSAGAVPGR